MLEITYKDGRVIAFHDFTGSRVDDRFLYLYNNADIVAIINLDCVESIIDSDWNGAE